MFQHTRYSLEVITRTLDDINDKLNKLVTLYMLYVVDLSGTMQQSIARIAQTVMVCVIMMFGLYNFLCRTLF